MGKGDEIILKHYKKVAKSFGKGPHSSMQDQFIREKEIEIDKIIIPDIKK